MKSFYRIFLLLLVLVLLSTYNPLSLSTFKEKETSFFKIKNIEIINNSIIENEEISKRLSYIYKKNLILIKGETIKKLVDSLDFLEKIEVKKKSPNTIIIKIFETNPIAILHIKEKKYLLDSSSKINSFREDLAAKDLPNIFGEDAGKYFQDFFYQLESSNFPKNKIKNYYYFQIGRWDLQLINDKIIKFPDVKTINAIKKSIELINRKDFINYNVIDLRVPGKIVVE